MRTPMFSRRSFAQIAAALGLAGVIAAAPAVIAEDAPFGPAVGSPAPHDLALNDHAGAARDLDALLQGEGAQNGVVVYFNRSLDWCPFCKKQALDVEARLSEYADRGYGVVTITTDTSELLAEFIERRNAQGVYLADPDRVAIQAFDIVDPVFADREPGDRGYGLPFPSAFIIQSDKTVAATLYEADSLGERRGYVERITVDLVLEQIDALNSAS